MRSAEHDDRIAREEAGVKSCLKDKVLSATTSWTVFFDKTDLHLV